ncbi:MAG: MlaE family ABC transporter permease [Deferribacterales bacterium]|jgi:phospholipid/cholesterol/gamma-HCH transport system permease protein
MKQIIRKLGKWAIDSAIFYYGYVNFTINFIKGCFNIRLLNPSVKLVIFRQVYFTGVQILPMFSLISIVIGLALVGGLTNFLVQFGAQDRVGDILVLVTVKQLAPIVVAILLTLRSSTAVTAEIALMKMNNEIETLKSLSINPFVYLYIPRILSGVVCMGALATIFVYISIIGGYLILSFNLNISFDFLIQTIFDAFNFKIVLVFLIKVLLMGYFVMSIPIYTALQVGNAVTEIPIALLKGMLRLFYALILVEVLGALI